VEADDMMAKKLEKDFQYFLDHKEELIKKYNGRCIVIKNCEVIGDFDNELIAIKETTKIHPLGTFIVQICDPGEESYTATFHSRVNFS
jgi:hypothetical protein